MRGDFRKRGVGTLPRRALMGQGNGVEVLSSGAPAPVVVGVDGPGPAMGAVRWAADEAAMRSRPLRVVCALGSADPQLASPAWRLVDDAICRARAWQPQVQVTGLVRPGTPTAELCAESAHAELIVVGSHGRGFAAGQLLGSVSYQVAVHARCPVLVVRNAQVWAVSDVASSSQRSSPQGLRSQRAVSVGLDGSEAADVAAGFAFEEAGARRVAVMAVRAWQPPRPSWCSTASPLIGDVDEIETAERDLLSESVGGWRAKHPHVPVQLRLARGSSGAALVNASREVQLIVVGSRGRGGFAGVLLGSTSQQLLHHADCPVLIVRQRERSQGRQPGDEPGGLKYLLPQATAPAPR